jgi:archaemetzincin
MVGSVEPDMAAQLAPALDDALGLEVRLGPALAIPADAWEPARAQFNAARILRDVAAAHPKGAAKTLGLTEADLFHPILTFLYGQAQLNGPAALVSLARLRQGFYGLPPNRDLTLDRLKKEALHELGHTYGLTHCRNSACAMALSTALEQLDAKHAAYCQPCRLALTQEVLS